MERFIVHTQRSLTQKYVSTRWNPRETIRHYVEEAVVSLQKGTSFPPLFYGLILTPLPPWLFSFHPLTLTKIDCLNLAHLRHLLSADRNRFSAEGSRLCFPLNFDRPKWDFKVPSHVRQDATSLLRLPRALLEKTWFPSFYVSPLSHLIA